MKNGHDLCCSHVIDLNVRGNLKCTSKEQWCVMFTTLSAYTVMYTIIITQFITGTVLNMLNTKWISCLHVCPCILKAFIATLANTDLGFFLCYRVKRKFSYFDNENIFINQWQISI